MRLTKLKLTGLLLSIIIATTVFFVACDNEEVATQLAVPTEVSVDGGELGWKMVAGAAKYAVSVDGATPTEVSATKYSLASLTEAKDYKLKVKALGDGTHYSDSDFSAEVTYTVNETTTLSFVTNGGNVLTDVSARAGASLELPSPVKTNHDFVGWYEDEEFETAFTSSTMPTESKTLYARWIADWSEVYNYTTTNDTRTLTGLTTFGTTLTQLVVPQTINGKPVTDINGAFGSTIAKSVTIPSFIKTVSGSMNSGIAVVTIEHTEPFSATAPSWANVKMIIVPTAAKATYAEKWTSVTTKLFAPDEIAQHSDYVLSADGEKILAFFGSSTTFEIPSGVETIGASAFSGSTLVSVVVGNDVETIEANGFSSSAKLVSVTLGNNLKTIGDNAFNYCSSLMRLDIPASVETIGASALPTAITIFKATTAPTIQSNTFTSYSAKKMLTPTGATGYNAGNWASISNTTFCETTLTSGEYSDFVVINNILEFYLGTASEVTIPSGVTAIGASAFRSNIKVTSVTINDGVTLIGADAFNGCTNLKAITLPASITSIGSSALYSCNYVTLLGARPTINNSFYSLTVIIVVPDKAAYKAGADYTNGWSSIVNRVFEASDIDANGFVVVDGVLIGYVGTDTQITIPSDVTVLNDYLFYNNTALTSVNLNNVEEIKGNVFTGCTSISTITIPNTVEKMGYSIFGSWTANQTINIKFADLATSGWGTSWTPGSTAVKVVWGA